MSATITVQWLDFGREPECPPDPNYPSGKDVDASIGAKATCVALLPCPAPRCGAYAVRCQVCGMSVAVTTAGRPDDPRSVKIACRLEGRA